MAVETDSEATGVSCKSVSAAGGPVSGPRRQAADTAGPGNLWPTPLCLGFLPCTDDLAS